jgi:hypothetical protein
MPKMLTDIRALARAHGPSMINVLASIARQKTAPPSARVSAASTLLDRGYGKAEQPSETNSDIQITIRQILDGTAQPKLVKGRVIEHAQPEVRQQGRTVENEGRTGEDQGRTEDAAPAGAPRTKGKR